MSTFCTFETEYRLTRVDRSFRRLALRCTWCNSRMGEFIWISNLWSRKVSRVRVARAGQKDALPQTYCQSPQNYYDRQAASPVEDRLHVRARHRQRVKGGIPSRAMLVDP